MVGMDTDVAGRRPPVVSEDAPVRPGTSPSAETPERDDPDGPERRRSEVIVEVAPDRPDTYPSEVIVEVAPDRPDKARPAVEVAPDREKQRPEVIVEVAPDRPGDYPSEVIVEVAPDRPDDYPSEGHRRGGAR